MIINLISMMLALPWSEMAKESKSCSSDHFSGSNWDQSNCCQGFPIGEDGDGHDGHDGDGHDYDDDDDDDDAPITSPAAIEIKAIVAKAFLSVRIMMVRTVMMVMMIMMMMILSPFCTEPPKEANWGGVDAGPDRELRWK